MKSTDPAINEGWAYLTLRSLADDYDDAESGELCR